MEKRGIGGWKREERRLLSDQNINESSIRIYYLRIQFNLISLDSPAQSTGNTYYRPNKKNLSIQQRVYNDFCSCFGFLNLPTVMFKYRKSGLPLELSSCL